MRVSLNLFLSLSEEWKIPNASNLRPLRVSTDLARLLGKGKASDDKKKTLWALQIFNKLYARVMTMQTLDSYLYVCSVRRARQTAPTAVFA